MSKNNSSLPYKSEVKSAAGIPTCCIEIVKRMCHAINSELSLARDLHMTNDISLIIA